MKLIIRTLLLLGIIATGCKKKQSNDISTATTTQYLTAYTRGVIKDTDDIIFAFKQGVDIDKTQIRNAISIEPSIDFKISFNSYNNSVVIKPTKLKRNQDYTVQLNLSKLTNARSTVTSNIKVQGQFVTIKRKGLVIDRKDGMAIEFEINTAFEEQIAELKKMFDIDTSQISITKVDDQHYNGKITYDGINDLNVKWNGKILQAKEQGEIFYSANNLKVFKVLSTYENKKNRTLTAYFTQPIDTKQDLTGLVKIGKQNAKCIIDGNKLTVKIKAQNSESADIVFKPGIVSTKGKKTTKDFVYGITIELIRPQLEWLATGNYIPASGKFKIPFRAKGLREVKVAIAAITNDRAGQFMAWNDIKSSDQYELIRYGDFVLEKDIDLSQYASNLEHWNEFGIDLSDAFEREPGTIYRLYLSYNPSQTILNCDNIELQDYESKTLETNWFDQEARYYDYYDHYNYNDRYNPCKVSFYSQLRPLTMNVHCTNVFPIIKKGGKGVTVAVKDLETNTIPKGAEISLLSLQGKTIATKTSGTGGVLKFDGLTRDAKAICVKHNGFTSYFSMPQGQENSITEFDISSNVKSTDNKLFVYSERDVRRPGDTIFINVMLNAVDYEYPEDLPVTLRLYNPKNVLVANQRQALTKDKLIYSFAIPTSIEAPTGYWNAKISVGPTKVSYDVRVETIKPNVVDATYSLNGQEKNWIYNNKLIGKVNVQYLAGYAMKNGKVKANANVYPVRTPFDKYKDYQFNKYKLKSQKDIPLYDGSSDANGDVNIDSKVDFKKQESVCRIVLDTKIDLPGGGNNTQSTSYIVSPYASYTGIEKVRGRGWRGSFRYGDTPMIRLIHLDQRGKPTTGDVKVTIYKAKKDWWYDRYRLSNNYSVRSSEYYVKVDQFTETFGSNGEAIYKHGDKLGSGLFVIETEDLKSGHISEYKFHAVNSSNYAVTSNPIFIQLELEKYDYNVGEKMQVKMPDIKDAKALVSIEKGDKIIETFWMDLSNPNLELEIKDEYYPNFYLNVSVVQNYEHDNDRPMRMYTVEKINVNERKLVIKPTIDTPEKVEPNKTFTVKVSEENGQPMEYTLAVVDRGLLNLTGFTTPNPLRHFSKKFPLLVKTWDIFSHLMFYSDPSFSGVFGIGGDGVKKLDESASFNRFEPVVYHLGPFKLDKNGMNSHEITLPNYIGNLRVMVVAVNEKTFGQAEKNVRVASPLMIQSQLPRALNISDQVQLPVTIFKDEQSITSAHITATNSNGAVTFSTNDIDVSLSNDDQALGELKFEVNEIAGKTTIDLNSTAGKYKSNESTDIFVNYPNSYSEKTTYYELSKDETENIGIDAFGFDKTKHVSLTLSGLILPAFSEYYSSLIGYPHGCLEQTSSKGFCLLYAGKMIELDADQKAASERHLDAALRKIYRFQQSNGSFKYWQNGYYHAWADLYAANFLLEAVEQGVEINQDVLNNWLRHTADIADAWTIEGAVDTYMVRREEMTQAYRLFLLAKANGAEKSAMNRFRKRNLTPMAKIFLAGAYHYSGMDDIGDDLLNEGLTDFSPYRYSYHTFGSNLRNRCVALMLLSIMKDGDEVSRYYKQLVKDLNAKRWLSTQEKGWALMACHYYFKDKGAKGNQTVAFDLSSNTHNRDEVVEKNTYERLSWKPTQMGDNAKVVNTGESKLFVVKTERAISDELYPPAQENNVNLTVSYTDLKGNAINLKDMKQGQEINIIVRVQNDDIIVHESLAMSLKMPSGWELLNPRILNTAKLRNDGYIYQDYRDDKVYTYFGLGTNQGKEYQFRAIANLKGDFYMPAVKVEHMYLGTVNAATIAQRVTIR